MSFGPEGLQLCRNGVALLINDVCEERLTLQAALNKILREKHKWEQVGQKSAARGCKRSEAFRNVDIVKRRNVISINTVEMS